jgi:acid phosphatase (class A)
MKHLITVFLFLILSACSATTESYFTGKTIPIQLIEPPYADKSKEQNEEIQQILKAQKNFNVNELELAAREKFLRPEIFVLYTDLSLTRETYPDLYRLIDRVSITCKQSNDHFKYHWNATRPYLIDKRVNMLITPSPGPGYPSGHVTTATTITQVLGMLFPEKKQDLAKLAKRIASRRILVGMHFPHDIAAGEQLSQLVIGGLFQNEDFLKDLEEARKELVKNPPKNIKPTAAKIKEEPSKEAVAPSVAPNDQALPAQ